MSWLDNLPTLTPNSVSEDYSFYDADTLTNKDGELFRLRGFDAPEISKLRKDGFEAGEAGGAAATETLAGLAKEQGYTNMRPVIGKDGKPVVGEFGRPIVDLTNEAGESFTDRVLAEGIFDPTKYTDTRQQNVALLGEAERRKERLQGTQQDEWSLAQEKLRQAELEEGAKSLGFKQQANNERELAQLRQAGLGDRYVSTSTMVDNPGVDINNRSTNPFSDSWDQGWMSVTESSYGILNMLGEQMGSEALADIGEDGVERARARMGEFGTTVLDYKDVDSIGSAWEYLGNNFALSLPYMAATVVGTAAAPATAGVSLTLPVSLYTGQVWNEMEGDNKNAAVAIGAGVAQATLDRLGLKGIISTTGAPKKMMKDAVSQLVKQGMTKEAANQAVVQASRREIASLVGSVKDIAKQQIAAKQVFKDISSRFGVAAGGEAGTEALQEAIGYTAAHLQEGFDFNELNERMIAGAVAGAALGGSFTVPGAAYNTGAWADVAYRLEDADNSKASLGEAYATEEKKNFGRVASIEELAADARARSLAAPGLTLDERAEAFKEDQMKKSAVDRFTEKALNVSALWQGATRNIFTPDLQARSRSARILADMFGGNLQRIFHGSNFENTKFHNVSRYKNMVPEPKQFWQNYTGKGNPNSKLRGEASAEIYNQLNAAVDKKGNFNPDAIPDGPNKAMLVDLGHRLQKLGDEMYKDQAKYSPELGYLKNYLFKHKAISKAAVQKNKGQFIDSLTKHYNMPRGEAIQVADNIIHNDQITDIDEAFSVVKGGIVPGSHRKRTLALSENKEFQDFVEQDLFANVSSAAKSAARFAAHRQFIGQNGGVVSKLLDDMKAEGVAEAEVNKVASRIKDYLDAESGNYKRPTSELGKNAIALQKNFMLFTTLSGLPLATISSLVESALVHKALTVDQIFGKDGSLRKMGTELANTMWKGGEQVATAGLAKTRDVETSGQEILKRLGFYEWDVGAATVTGVSETNPAQQALYEKFFKYSGLTGYTNFTRASRASIGMDFVNDKADLIFKHRLSGEPRTREIQEAEEALRNLGIDVDGYVGVYETLSAGIELSPEQEAIMQQVSTEGMFNFINDAVALPQSQNRPLIYQDPRLALFTQFQGFIATFTANHIPKLWGEYVKRGTPAMKYNAFATMTMMIALGFASQYLKDLIKYGQSSPHLDDAEYLQRGIRASGLLGTGERVLDQFFPIYEQKTDGVGDWVFKTGTGESPALSHAGRIAKAGGKLLEGDVGQAAKYGFKSAPLVGPFSGKAEQVGEFASQWNFKGGG